MGLEASVNKSLLDPHDPLEVEEEDGTVTQITVEKVREDYNEYKDIISWCWDIENGNFTLTFEDYKKLPSYLIESLKIFKSWIVDKRNEGKK
jgi:hypothetical protein